MDGNRVLIVEDDSSVRRVLVRVFEQAGFEVAMASNGEKAVEVLAGGQFDLMISDINMPKMDGQELCEHLSADGPYLPECIFIVTASAEDEKRDWVGRFPNITVVEKPVGPRQLLQLVKQRLAEGVPA